MIEDQPISSFDFYTEESDYISLDTSRTYYLEGKKAMSNGALVDDCPYEDERLATLWKMGWQSATIV